MFRLINKKNIFFDFALLSGGLIIINTLLIITDTLLIITDTSLLIIDTLFSEVSKQIR